MTTLKSLIAQRQKLILGLAAALLIIIGIFVFRPAVVHPLDSYAACVNAGYPVLESDPPVCREGSHNFTGTPLPKASSAPDLTNLSYEILVNGDTHVAVPEHHQQFINSASQWQAYWARVHSGLSIMPPLLPVDFSKNDVVGVSLGRQMTSGYGLKITGVTATTTGTVVSLTESTPTITCSVDTQASNRYVIVRTPKLLEPVSFRITTEKRRC